MAKFIIEVDDEYIRENADPQSVRRLVKEEGRDALKVMFDLMGFMSVQNMLADGKSEFRISKDLLKNPDMQEYFDRNVGDICHLAKFCEDSKGGDAECQGKEN